MGHRYKLNELKLKIGDSNVVSLARYKGKYYFSVNGIDSTTGKKKAKETKNKNRIVKTLNKMYHHKTQFCDYTNAITVVAPTEYRGNDYYYKYNQLQYHTNITTKNHVAFIFNMISPLKYPIGIQTNFNRNWSCAEKKIVGFIESKTPIINRGRYYNDYDIDFYITKRPCILCTPLVSTVHYLDDNNNLVISKYKTTVFGNAFLVD